MLPSPRSIVLLVVLALPLTLAACGEEKSETAAGGGGGGQSYNQTDARFVASMLPHHTGGVELGEMAAEKGTSEDIRRLGEGIVKEQTQEKSTLEAMVKRFGTEEAMAPAIEERDMMDMAALRRASGKEFDMMWLDVISGHHAAAIQMADIEAGGGKDPEAKRLAESIVSSQTRELEEFNELSEQMK